MLADIESGSLDGVLIYNIDRLTRRPIEFEQFHVVAERAGIPLRCVTGDADFGTEDGMLLGRMQAAFAAKESAAKSRRQKRKNDEKAASGFPTSANAVPMDSSRTGPMFRPRSASSARWSISTWQARASWPSPDG